MSQLLLDIAPDSQPTLDNFVVGRNLELLSALRHALWRAAASGVSMCGARPAAARAICCKPACVPHWTCSKTRSMRMAAFRPRLWTWARRSWRWMMSSNLMMRRKSHCSISTTRCATAAACCWSAAKESPLHLKLRDDLRTRLGWGLVYQVHVLSDEEKAQALVQHAHSRGFVLPSEVTQYLLRHGRRDLPSLMAVLDALDAHSLHRLPQGSFAHQLKKKPCPRLSCSGPLLQK